MIMLGKILYATSSELSTNIITMLRENIQELLVYAFQKMHRHTQTLTTMIGSNQ